MHGEQNFCYWLSPVFSLHLVCRDQEVQSQRPYMGFSRSTAAWIFIFNEHARYLGCHRL